MALKITAPIEQLFPLDETNSLYPPEDGEDPSTVTIRQAGQHEHETRMKMFEQVHTELSYDAAGRQVLVSRETRNPETLKRLEVFLTMSDCNIMIIPEGKKKAEALFKFKDGKLDMTSTEFKEAWGKLPIPVSNEIHRKVMEVNLDWTRRGEG